MPIADIRCSYLLEGQNVLPSQRKIPNTHVPSYVSFQLFILVPSNLQSLMAGRIALICYPGLLVVMQHIEVARVCALSAFAFRALKEACADCQGMPRQPATSLFNAKCAE